METSIHTKGTDTDTLKRLVTHNFKDGSKGTIIGNRLNTKIK